LILSAGIGGASFAEAVSQACGDAVPCAGDGLRRNGAVSASYWFNRFLAAEVGYVQPSSVNTTGSGTSFTFTSSLESRLLTIDGKTGGQLGPVRIYGLAGVNHASATSTTVQNATAGTIAMETFALKAEGWGWLAGGGVEGWVARRVGLYVEGDAITIKGSAVNGGQGAINDTLIFVTGGVRIAIRPSAAKSAPVPATER
jgi:hypothetical protein